MKRIEIYENGINIVFEITDENEAKLLHFSALPFDEAKTASYMGLKTFRPVEIQASGIDRPDERHGNKYIVTAPGWRMKFKDFRDVNNDYGRKLELVTFDEGTGLEAVPLSVLHRHVCCTLLDYPYKQGQRSADH